MRVYPKIIDLTPYNRYGEPVKLIQINRSKFKLVTEDSYLRCIFETDNKTINAVDPSGGPFISIGYVIDAEYHRYSVEKIYHSLTYQGFIIELKVV